ncbi:hypothetical protein [Streptomyces sp.]|uniref:hypothetical protein n=1 Tax=Streptomyces sp. TaxID=1931 RepID=UPI002D6B287E|nr:hypothetical protein [Streptomyces sp.]HZF91561.1 hypothetical protein [Streptomyces sp.]
MKRASWILPLAGAAVVGVRRAGPGLSGDKFPLGAVVDKGLTGRGAQMRGQRYIPMLPERMAAGELTTAHLATPTLPREQAPKAYGMFKHKTDGCVRAVIRPTS